MPLAAIVDIGAATAVLLARARRRRARQGAAALDPRNRDQTAIEFTRLALAAEAAPVPRREIVALLFDTKIVDETEGQ
jgi:hypothetical protein